MGVTSKGLKGNSFDTIEDGVRAQMQHLYAYANKLELPKGEELIDPRFKYVTRGIAPDWEDLNMRWAMNDNYGQHILSVQNDLIEFIPPVIEKEPEPVEKEPEPVKPEPKPEKEEKLNVGLFNKLIQLIYDLLSGKKKK
jgi:hypothetical protein